MDNRDTLDNLEIGKAYGYGAVSDDTRARMAEVRAMYREVAEKTVMFCPASRARSVALTNLQTAKMFAVQSIAESDGRIE